MAGGHGGWGVALDEGCCCCDVTPLLTGVVDDPPPPPLAILARELWDMLRLRWGSGSW